MRIIARLLPVVLFISLALGNRAIAQLEHLPEAIRHKIRITPEQIRQALRAKEDAAPLGGAAGAAEGRETIVSSDQAIESEVHAAVNPADSNNIIVSPIRQGANPLEGLLCPIYYTKDFGKTWTKSVFKTLPRGETNAINVGGGDPMLAFDADGKAYLVWISLYIRNLDFSRIYYGLLWAYSADGGATWIQAESDAIARASFEGGGGDAWFYDKEWSAFDHSNSPYRNTFYVAFLQANQAQETQQIAIRKKSPGSAGFDQESIVISDASFEQVQFSNIGVDPNGGVHVTFYGLRQGGDLGLWHALSTNGGASFGAPQRITHFHFPRFSPDAPNDSIPGILGRRLYPCPNLAIDNSTTATRGNLYMTWTADGVTGKRNEGLDIYFSRSTDNGATWSAPIIVNDDPRGQLRHQFYPSIAVNQAGVVTLTWYDRRGDALHHSTDYYMAHSFDGGRTFEKNFAVSTSPTDFSRVGMQNQGFGIGEYTQVLSTPGHAVAVWSDGRGNAGDLNIYASFVPIARDASGVARGMSVSEGFELFDPSAAGIGFRLDRPSRATLRLYDLTGRVVATLADGSFEPGEHRFTFDRAVLASGTYYYHLETGMGNATRVMVK